MQTTAELLAAGFTEIELRRLVRQRELARVRRGVYADIGSPEDDSSAMSAVHRYRRLIRATWPGCSAGSVLSHHSAAVLWGLRVDSVPDRVEITRPPSNGGQDRGCVHLRIARLDASEVSVVDGLPVTSMARTVVDLARCLPPAQSVVTGDAALAAGVRAPELDACLALATRRPGVVRARRACGFFDGRSESGGESVSRVHLVAGGLSVPELQHEIRTPGGRLIGRSDFFWPEHRTIGEFDGRVKYGRLLKPGEDAGDVVFAEKRREDAIRRCGLEVVRWTWADLFRRGLVVGWIEDAFTRRAA